MSVADLRREYGMAGLTESEVTENPFTQFTAWLADARSAHVLEPNAMTLATATKAGVPSARVVLLKGIDMGGFDFFTNHLSRKGEELGENPHAAIVFFWPELERQVRATGLVSMLDRASAEKYFALRPRGGQLGAWASPRQSEVIASRAVIEENLRQCEARFAEQEVPVPEYWGGYRLMPDQIEFWQGRPNRLHDRILYTRTNSQWSLNRLSP